MLIKGKNPISPNIPILAYPQGVLLVIGGMYYFIELIIELINYLT
jgi:hypothetical protein